MNDVERFSRLKQQVASAQREADKAQGALDGIVKRLKQEFDCASLEEAEKMLAQLHAEEQALSARFGRRLTKFEKKWGKALGD